MTCLRFSQRLLNPFRGTLQVIRHGAAEAVSMDGIEWDIYVANDSLLVGLDGAAQVSDIRYGHWSAARGLKRGPLYPSADFRRMEALGATVYAHLRRYHLEVPFPARDDHEYWLLDTEGLPLALLQADLAEDDRRAAPTPRWSVGLSARDDFRVAGIDEAAANLERLVNGRAGPAPRGRWYRRLADGSGISLDDSGDTLASACFPPLLVAQAGWPPGAAELVNDYLAWQAVWLLCLPNLEPATRRRLESRAGLQAERVEALHRLYPEIIEASAINAARVAARLASSQAARPGEADTQATFYIELNPQGGGYT